MDHIYALYAISNDIFSSIKCLSKTRNNKALHHKTAETKHETPKHIWKNKEKTI